MRGAEEGDGSPEGLVARIDAMTPGSTPPHTVPSGVSRARWGPTG